MRRRTSRTRAPDDIDEDDESCYDDTLACGCTVGDAADGCECADCDEWRCDNEAPGGGSPLVEHEDGDGVRWLESLYKLRDNRRKR